MVIDALSRIFWFFLQALLFQLTGERGRLQQLQSLCRVRRYKNRSLVRHPYTAYGVLIKDSFIVGTTGQGEQSGGVGSLAIRG